MPQNGDHIGYGKPPKHTRFRTGISGNPKGRPRGSRNLKTILEEVLQEKIVVGEKGGRKVVTKFDAVIHQLVNKAIDGDIVASRLLLNLTSSIETKSEGAQTTQLSEPDFKVLRTVLERLESPKEASDET